MIYLDKKEAKLLCKCGEQRLLNYKKCKECLKKSTTNSANWRLRHPEKYLAFRKRGQRNYTLKRNFNMTREQYEELKQRQNNLCAICDRTTEENGKDLAVDHVHGSNPIIIRGLLCDICNRAVGLLRDNPMLFLKASIYLRRISG